MATSNRTKQIGLVAALVVVAGLGFRLCAKRDGGTEGSAPSGAAPTPNSATGLSAPIAAARAPNGDVLVAGLDATAKGIRVQRIDANDRSLADRIVLSDVAGSNDADLKLVAPSKDGAAIRWRGLRGGKLSKDLVLLGPDLAPKGEPSEVGAALCATKDAVWSSEGKHATARRWDGTSSRIDLPKEEEASLLCGSTSAFAVLAGEERTSLLPLTGEKHVALTVLRENDFGDDEERETTEYTVGDDVGMVRLGASGSVAVRELVNGALGPLRRLKAALPKDDDLVAVDASPKVLTLVYTHDVSSECPAKANDTNVSTKILALRVDRQTFEESIVELAPGKCGYEVGPFMTGVVGEGVSVAWSERTGGAGKPRAPITALAHTVVGASGKPVLARIEQAAEALVDAGCDGTRCAAVALVRREGEAAAFAKVLRY
jgi:hypothetical protein